MKKLLPIIIAILLLQTAVPAYSNDEGTTRPKTTKVQRTKKRTPAKTARPVTQKRSATAGTSAPSFKFKAPSSISLVKPLTTDYMKIFLDANGKVFFKFQGNPADPETSTPAVKKSILESAVRIYNEFHPESPVKISDEAVNRFVKAEYIGTSVKSLAAGGAATSTGLTPSDRSDDIKIWLRAFYMGGSDEMRFNMRMGTGIIIEANGSTQFRYLKALFRQLCQNRCPNFSLMTSVMSYINDTYTIMTEPSANLYVTSIYLPSMDMYMSESHYEYPACFMPLTGILTDTSRPDSYNEDGEAQLEEVTLEELEAEEEAEEEEDVEAIPSFPPLKSIPASRIIPICAGGDFPSAAYASFFSYPGTIGRFNTNVKKQLFGGRSSMAAALSELNGPVVQEFKSLNRRTFNHEISADEYQDKKKEIATSSNIYHPVAVIKMLPGATYSTFVATMAMTQCAYIYDYRIILD